MHPTAELGRRAATSRTCTLPIPSYQSPVSIATTF